MPHFQGHRNSISSSLCLKKPKKFTFNPQILSESQVYYLAIFNGLNTSGVLTLWPRVLETLQTKLNIFIDVTALSLDSTSIKVHPDGTGALKNFGSYQIPGS